MAVDQCSMLSKHRQVMPSDILIPGRPDKLKPAGLRMMTVRGGALVVPY